MARCSRVIGLVIAAGLGLSHIPHAGAQFFGGIVYDPTNYSQNLQTAIHNYNQLIRQAQQLQNEANMLINQAKHLSKLDINSASELNRLLGEIAFINSQAEHVAYTVNRTRTLLQEQYPETYAGLSKDEIYARSERQFENSQAAYHESMIMQSKMVETLETDRAMLGQLMNASHNSVGDLQATQTTNQLMGLLVKQAMQAQQLQVTQSRAESVEAARDIAIEAEARALREQFLGDPQDAYSGGGR